MHLREYVLVIRHRWWIIALAAVVAVVTSLAVARSQAPIYRSSVSLEVNGRIDYGQIMAIDKLLRQLAARVTTTTVAEAVSQRLASGLGPDELLGKLHTQAFTDTMHIQIQVDDSDPARAERIAAAFATVVHERQVAANAAVPEPERVNVSVLDRPTPGRLFAPQPGSLALAGGLLGVLVGLILVLILDYVDETFRGARDVERSLGLPVIGVVPTRSPLSTPLRGGRTRNGVTERHFTPTPATAQGQADPPPQPSPARGDGGRTG